MTEKRKGLLKRLENFRAVPGHGPDIEAKTDDELELYVKLLESMFERAFAEKDNGGDDGL
ncbi:hypothetical protein M5X17_13015 [Paenibacillus alvei]|uniref:Uncharacterized protein n=1 Tax=Paenibacillus alvei TaxID=44250 RepID=A0ABT4GWX9_PAEAL|nr:hypothetical protein [Paenibacillus alvei]MCY9734654.1 hypothetical protein [Paenibacillus alvei]MCY9761221.1 hypothetical protein [Paenibacillus alvei]MCY9765734.1 hypothetical protein [Paenibacillus alvei]